MQRSGLNFGSFNNLASSDDGLGQWSWWRQRWPWWKGRLRRLRRSVQPMQQQWGPPQPVQQQPMQQWVQPQPVQQQPMQQWVQPQQPSLPPVAPSPAPSWTAETLAAPAGPLPGTYQTAAGVTRVIHTDAANIAAQGGVVTGSQMTTQQALTSPGQSSFTRSTDKPGDNRRPDHWSDLGPAPPGFNEQIYLQKNPDIATAVKAGAMPSGLWHYLKYGKAENRAFSGWGRSMRRPGYLAGIFANWNIAD